METDPACNEGPGEASQTPAKQSADLSQSLYVGDIYMLEFGDNLVVKVPRSVIDKHPTFAANFIGRFLYMTEMNKTEARILVHYLYTGKYQAPEPKADEKRQDAFTVNLRVYFSAVRYHLEHLAVLASMELTKLGDDLAFIEILGIIEREEFDIGEDEFWLAGYMAYRAQRFEPVTQAQVQSFRAGIGEERTLVNILIGTVLDLKLEVQRLRALLEDGRGQG